MPLFEHFFIHFTIKQTNLFIIFLRKDHRITPGLLEGFYNTPSPLGAPYLDFNPLYYFSSTYDSHMFKSSYSYAKDLLASAFLTLHNPI